MPRKFLQSRAAALADQNTAAKAAIGIRVGAVSLLDAWPRRRFALRTTLAANIDW